MAPKIEQHVALAPLTTLQVGGTAAYFCRLTAEEQLPEVMDFSEAHGVSPWVIGGGSNVLIADGLIRRLVIKNELSGVAITPDARGEVLVTAAAGESWDALVALAVEHGLTGLENLSGIPGTVGAAPIQNINAYGAQVADVIDSVRVFDIKTRSFRNLTKTECAFGYRDSIFKREAGASYLVTAVTFKLAPAGATTNLTYRSASQSIERFLREQGIAEPTLHDVRQAILHVRSNIGMLLGQYRSAGSFFKNTIVQASDFTRIKDVVTRQFPDLHERLSPWYWELPNGQVKISTAFLMECTPYNKRTYGEKRWKGVVGLSPKHSLSVVTEGNVTATEVQNFVALIVAAVHEVFGLTIETEVNFIA